MTGCVGLIPAGTECEITTTLYDQFGNTIPLTQAGTLSYSVNDGVYTESSNMYFADTVGSWQLSVTSTIGLSDSIAIETGHGEMASLEIVPSSWDITADEVVYSTQRELTSKAIVFLLIFRLQIGPLSMTVKSMLQVTNLLTGLLLD